MARCDVYRLSPAFDVPPTLIQLGVASKHSILSQSLVLKSEGPKLELPFEDIDLMKRLLPLYLLAFAATAAAQTPIGSPKGEPTNAVEASAQKAKADAVVEESYQALVAKLPPDQQAWERVLQSQLGSFYLPLHKRDKVAGRSNAWDFVPDDPKLPRVLLIGTAKHFTYSDAMVR